MHKIDWLSRLVLRLAVAFVRWRLRSRRLDTAVLFVRDEASILIATPDEVLQRV